MTISDEESAKKIVAAMLAVYRELEDSAAFVQNRLPGEEFKTYRRAVGSVLGECWILILKDVLEQYPALRPPELMDEASE
jgi:hypothetical protein